MVKCLLVKQNSIEVALFHERWLIMRTARLFGEGVSYYHCISRVVDKTFIFFETEMQCFRKIMRKLEAFTGIEVLTYVIMSNHFHLLLKVDETKVVSDEEVIRRVSQFYGGEHAQKLRTDYDNAISVSNTFRATELIDQYRHRMNHLSQFMKELKQSFSIAYNSSHDRHGTLWEERFTSMLIEGEAKTLSMTAAYIELNPVRAGLVLDPKNYRYSGYGEACAGKSKAQKGLNTVMNALGLQSRKSWEAEEYRKFLFSQGITYQKGGTDSADFIKLAEQVLEQNGVLSMNELLYCRVHHFVAGVAIGSRDFIDKLFVNNKPKFGAKRTTGAREMACRDQELCTFRNFPNTPVSITPRSVPPDV